MIAKEIIHFDHSVTDFVNNPRYKNELFLFITF